MEVLDRMMVSIESTRDMAMVIFTDQQVITEEVRAAKKGKRALFPREWGVPGV